MDSLSFALLYLGLMALSLSIKRHYKQVFQAAAPLGPRRKLCLRLVGAGLILACVGLTIGNLGVGLGLVYVFGAVSLAAMILSLGLSFLPRRLILVVNFLGLSLTLLGPIPAGDVIAVLLAMLGL